MLPFTPEPIEALKARYAAALAETFDVESVALGTTQSPGETPANIFDTPDGERLIVSRDAHGGKLGCPVHFSYSIHLGTKAHDRMCKMARRLVGSQNIIGTFRLHGESLFRLISGETRPLKFVGVSKGSGVPHWLVENSGNDLEEQE